MDDEVDVVVTGHTNWAVNCVIDGKIVTGAASAGRLVTDIDLTISRATKDVVSATVNNRIVTRTVPTDPDLDALVAHYAAASAPLANRVVGQITANITRSTSPAGESSLGNFIADSQWFATQPAELGGAVMAFMNPGGIRADLQFAASGSEGDGVVTYGEIFTVQPFGNSLVTMTLTGAQIEQMLEQQFVGCMGQTANRILQVSGCIWFAWCAAAAACGKVDPASIML
jgi:5'-nucleotidase